MKTDDIMVPTIRIATKARKIIRISFQLSLPNGVRGFLLSWRSQRTIRTRPATSIANPIIFAI
jgi:hypothetical protein